MDAWTFVNKEARFVNKPLKIILLVLAALVLLVVGYLAYVLIDYHLSLIHISEPTRLWYPSRMPSSA